MIAACYANPNWDGKDNAEKRKEYLRDLNDHFNRAITAINYPDGAAREAAVDWDNPFFAAHRREMVRTRKLFGLEPEDEDKPIGEVIEEERKQEQDQEVVPESNGHNRWDDLDQDIPRNR